MRLSFFDNDSIAHASVEKSIKKLAAYRAQVKEVITQKNSTVPEYSLVHANSETLHDTLATVTKQFKGIKHVVLVGIGGSSLGVEAVHSVLDTGVVKLTVLDTLAAYEIESLLKDLASLKKLSEIVVCVVSKSGNTAETLVNASILLSALKEARGQGIYKQTLFIGNAGTDFMKVGKRLGATCISMPDVVGGRYSVATEVGLIPLALLGHNVDAYIEGFLDAATEEIEEVVAQSAARIYQYIQKGYQHYNFFAFEKRLETLGAWYRQLYAESLGKAVDKAGKPVNKGMLPSITTAVELHSTGQLYMSGFSGVYTDFVTFDDEQHDFNIPKQGVAKAYGKFSIQEVTTAIYGGVIGVYNEKNLPYKTTIFEDDVAYELGLFMALRMKEIMYVAQLMDIHAFNQPDVELYKMKTKKILNI